MKLKEYVNNISIFVCSIPAQAVQENIAALLSLLRESVQLNLAPPGHFLLLGSVFTDEKLIYILKHDDVRIVRAVLYAWRVGLTLILKTGSYYRPVTTKN